MQVILGCKLLTQGSGHQLALTEEGKRLRAKVRSLLIEAREFGQGFDALINGVLNLGVSASIAETLVPEICIRFLKNYRQMQLRIHTANLGE